MAVFVWPPYLLFMTITSIRKNTKKGSASKRYKSQMARNTSGSHETTNRLLSWKKSAKVRKTLIIIIITKRLDKWVDFSAVKELWQRKILGPMVLNDSQGLCYSSFKGQQNNPFSLQLTDRPTPDSLSHRYV